MISSNSQALPMASRKDCLLALTSGSMFCSSRTAGGLGRLRSVGGGGNCRDRMASASTAMPTGGPGGMLGPAAADVAWRRSTSPFLTTLSSSLLPVSDKHSNQTHTRLTALFPGLPGWAGTTKVKPIWFLLKQETVSGSGISWAICKSAPCSRQITTPAPHHSVFLQAGCPSCRPTNSVKALKALMRSTRQNIKLLD